METLKQWMLHNLSTEDIIEIAEHGVDSDKQHICSLDNTYILYNKFHEEIWDIVIHKWKSLTIFVGSKGIESSWVFERLMTWEAMNITAEQIVREP